MMMCNSTKITNQSLFLLVSPAAPPAPSKQELLLLPTFSLSSAAAAAGGGSNDTRMKNHHHHQHPHHLQHHTPRTTVHQNQHPCSSLLRRSQNEELDLIASLHSYRQAGRGASSSPSSSKKPHDCGDSQKNASWEKEKEEEDEDDDDDFAEEEEEQDQEEHTTSRTRSNPTTRTHPPAREHHGPLSSSCSRIQKTLVDERAMDELLVLLQSNNFIGTVDLEYHAPYLTSPAPPRTLVPAGAPPARSSTTSTTSTPSTTSTSTGKKRTIDNIHMQHQDRTAFSSSRRQHAPRARSLLLS